MPAPSYRRPIDNALMVEVAPWCFVNALALGMADTERQRPAKAGVRSAGIVVDELHDQPLRARKPRQTEADFDALKAKRDESLAAQIDRVCAEQGWDRSAVGVHISGAGPCYCACPDGPCQHVWDGPEVRGENFSSASCSHCGTSAISHDMRCAP